MPVITTPDPRPRARRTRVWRALLYPLYVLLWIVAVHYFVFWLPFVAKMRNREKPSTPDLVVLKHMDPLTMRRLGTYRADRTSSFVNFSETKEAGVTRVCAFGDSFTYGQEAADGHDYPALLQGLLRRAGFAGAEVLNFGTGWHGFHQAYIMWDRVGRRFDCDYVLLGPRGFQPDRDTTFNHTFYRVPYYLHSRYVLDGDDVRLLDVGGVTHAERFADYFRFIPRWQYLRYDRTLVPSIKAILREDRTILWNPFYYFSGDMRSEALLTYERLLRKLATDAPQVVLVHDEEQLVATGKRLAMENLVAVRSRIPSRFPYRAPEVHLSAFGNALVARQFFHQIVDDDDAGQAIIETNDPPPVAVTAGPRPRPLSTYDRVELRAGNASVGYLTPGSDEEFGLTTGSAAILKERGVAGLLVLRDASTKLIDAKYTEINFILRDGDEAVLRTSDGRRTRPLGTVRLLDPGVNLGIVELPQVRTLGFDYIVGVKTVQSASLGPVGTQVDLWIRDHKVLAGAAGADEIHLQPMPGVECRIFTASAGQFVDVDAANISPQFDLVLEDAQGTLRVPIATWSRGTAPVPQADPPLPRRLNVQSRFRLEGRAPARP